MKKTGILFLSLGLAACGQSEQTETAAPAAPEAVAPIPAEPAGQEMAATETTGAMSGNELYAAKCVSCHGETGEGVADNPKLVGLTKADIQARLADYRAGKQMGPKTAVMAAMAKPLTDEQIAALATYVGE